MSLWRLSLAYLRTQWLTAGLNVLLLALGIGTITVLLLLGDQLRGNLQRDADGFDLVVGAKGSPVQLILSSVYHIDVPTGNIDLAEARAWARHRMVSQAIPLALGDSYRGYRIVGTEPAYPASYDAEMAQGRLWRQPLEAVLGARVAAQTGLAPGDTFVGAHGLAPGGHGHADNPYRIVGILAPTATVLDRLILTDVHSVWLLHGGNDGHGGHANQSEHAHQAPESDHHADEHADGDRRAHVGDNEPAGEQHDHDAPSEHRHNEQVAEQPDSHDPEAPAAPPSILDPDFDVDGRQITALLLKSEALTAGTMLPRLINRVSSLQAAAPVDEITRLLRLIGFGLDTLRAFAVLVILAAALSVFVALYNALRARRFDLAVMRSLGASRGLLLRHILLEGQILALAGVLLGMVLGHILTEGIGLWLRNAQMMRLTGWTWLPAETYLIALGAIVGLAAAMPPAVGAYRTDIARTLARA